MVFDELCKTILAEKVLARDGAELGLREQLLVVVVFSRGRQVVEGVQDARQRHGRHGDGLNAGVHNLRDAEVVQEQRTLDGVAAQRALEPLRQVLEPKLAREVLPRYERTMRSAPSHDDNEKDSALDSFQRGIRAFALHLWPSAQTEYGQHTTSKKAAWTLT